MRQRHVLLGWELGAGRGHVDKLFEAGALLEARGHKVSYALQRTDVTPPGSGGAAVWQAPIPPRLLVGTRKAAGPAPMTMGDILARLGLDDPAVVAGMVRGWLAILNAARPDLVIADYAPLLLLAARGRVPTIASGTGFDVPPSDMARFPALAAGSPAFDERRVLAAVDAGARRAGLFGLDRLPALFAADLQMPGTFAELDPYREWRRGPVFAPTVADPPPVPASPRGEEVFVYVHEGLPPASPLWDGLELSRLPVRAFVPAATDEAVAALERRGIAVERRPVSFPLIAERSRLLLSHGSHGFVCSGLLAGLPHVICHYDLEKAGTAHRLTGLGLGGHVPLHDLVPGPFAESLTAVYRDEALAARVREAAPDFRARMTESVSAQLVARAESLIFGH